MLLFVKRFVFLCSDFESEIILVTSVYCLEVWFWATSSRERLQATPCPHKEYLEWAHCDVRRSVGIVWSHAFPSLSSLLWNHPSALYNSSPQPFGHQAQLLVEKDNLFSMDQGWGDGFGMIQSLYIQAHLLLYSPAPDRPGSIPVLGLEVGDLSSTR